MNEEKLNALLLAEAKYRSIFDHAVHGIFQATPDGAFLMVNPAMAQILGFETPDELMRERAEIGGLRYVDPARREDFRRRIAGRDSVSGLEFEVFRKDGSRVWISKNARVIRDTAGRIKYYEGTVTDITEGRRAEASLQLANERFRALARRIQTIREQERTAIAREIHDVLAQELTRLKIDLVWVGKRLARPIDETLRPLLVQRVADATAQTDLAITTVQGIATELRPVILDSLGLSAAVEWQTEDFGRRTGLACRATAPGSEPALDRDCSTALFRILQESLTNIARHAHCAAVEVILAEEPGSITLTVRDDGRGITNEEVSDPRSIGLIGMSERAQGFGGTVRIAGAPGGGTVVTVQIPLQNQKQNPHPKQSQNPQRQNKTPADSEPGSLRQTA